MNLGPYDVRDVENADGIAESSPKKNWIYCTTRNVTKFAKFWMNKSKVGQNTYIKTWYGLVSVNIKLQKYYLNMNPACSACLCEWMTQMRGFVYYTHTEAHATLVVFSASATSIYEHIHEHFTISFE